MKTLKLSTLETFNVTTLLLPQKTLETFNVTTLLLPQKTFVSQVD